MLWPKIIEPLSEAYIMINRILRTGDIVIRREALSDNIGAQKEYTIGSDWQSTVKLQDIESNFIFR